MGDCRLQIILKYCLFFVLQDHHTTGFPVVKGVSEKNIGILKIF